MACFFSIMIGLTLNAHSEPFRKTAADMYAESYWAQMRRQTGLSSAEVRAENYRHLYEKCNEHHNCTNETAGEEARPEQSRKMDSRTGTMNPFLYSPVWM